MLKDLRKTSIDINKNRRRLVHDSDNRVVVRMNIKDDKDFLSVFSQSETPVISDAVADFIENSTAAIPPSEKIVLEIYSTCIDDSEKIDYRTAIKEYYTEKYIANKRDIKRNTYIAFALGLIGILILALAFVIEYKTGSFMWAEVIDIIAWVFLWEAVDISVFHNKSLRLKQMRYLSYISMDILYPEH